MTDDSWEQAYPYFESFGFRLLLLASASDALARRTIRYIARVAVTPVVLGATLYVACRVAGGPRALIRWYLDQVRRTAV